jgi:hypothetical protein
MNGSRIHPAGIVSALAISAMLSVLVASTVVARSPSVIHHVTAGGPDSCTGHGDKPGCDGNIALVASQYADGTATGQYTDRFANGDGIKAMVDCVRAVGNQAWISGWITSGRFGDNDLAGLPFSTRVVDNGTSAGQAPDQIGTSNVGDETPCTDMVPWALFAIPQGQVIVN